MPQSQPLMAMATSVVLSGGCASAPPRPAARRSGAKCTGIDQKLSAADICRRRRLLAVCASSSKGGAPSGSGGNRVSRLPVLEQVQVQEERPPQLPTASQQDSWSSKDGFRLFSNLNPETLRHEPGTVWGAAALVAGTTVGAGILALPAVTAESGFAASSAALGGCCLYSIVTGLLVAEVNINTLCELGAGRGVSLSSMARRTLGDGGAAAVSLTYALIHYTLLVAYIAKAGETVQQVSGLPLPLAEAVFAAAFGGLCFAARPTTLDAINSVLVGFVVASFLGLVGVTATDIHPEQLAVANWAALPDALPVITLSFVYQNVVPVIATSLEGDIAKIRQAIVLGTALPLAMFTIWDAAVLGSAGAPLLGGAAGADPLAALRLSGGALTAGLIDSFSFLAIATSFIGFVLGLSDFVADALQLPTGTRQAVPYLLTLAPPLLLAASFPGIFFDALDFAGTYGVLVLFGLMPVAMVWSERYRGTTLSRIQVVPGGRPLLLAVGASAAAIIARELFLAVSNTS